MNIGNKDSRRKQWVRWSWLLTIPLFVWAIDSAPIPEIIQGLANLIWWQIIVLVGINIGVFLLITLRWWILMAGMGYQPKLLTTFMVRLTSFAVSYITPGPQVGGEPVQVVMIQKREQIPPVVVISSVYLDRLIEFLGNGTFLVLAFGLVVSSGFFPVSVNGWLGLPLAGILIFPIVHLITLARRKLPFTSLLRKFGWDRVDWQRRRRVYLLVEQAESSISEFVRKKPVNLLLSVGVTGAAWVGMGLEYWLMQSYIGIDLPMNQMLLTFVASRLAFVVPLPAGLGALEASQVFALGEVGVGAAMAISLALLMRARDLLFGLTGLAYGGWSLRNIHLSGQNTRIIE